MASSWGSVTRRKEERGGGGSSVVCAKPKDTSTQWGMTQEIVETPVEPLVLGDDRTASISPMAPAVGLLTQVRATSSVDDDDDDAEDEEASASAPPVATIPLESASAVEATPEVVTSSRVVNPRVDSQNPLVFEPEPAEGAATQPAVVSQDEKSVPSEPTTVQNSPEVAVEIPSPTVEPQEPQEPVPTETKTSEIEATNVDTAPTLELLHELLYQKIAENQCSSHAKEIHEFVTSCLQGHDQAKLIPQVIHNLSQQFQREAKGQEVSVDIQTSICLIEQMLLPEGRRSPLQDMYTAEEEEMLNQLVHTGSSNNVLN